MLRRHWRSVPDRISQLRDTSPHSTALTLRGLALTYAQLNRRADCFASYLARSGVVPGHTVALCFERSFEWIIAALAIMRVGAAYVPLDRSWPDARLRFALEDSGASALIARSVLLDRLQVPVLGIDPFRDAAEISATTTASFTPCPIQPDSLAYIIYTSGSTGAPKGVEITHANLSHLVHWHSKTFNVSKRDRASHLLSLGFDAAVLEIWGHLSAGATLCLAEDDSIHSSPQLLQDWLLRERITIALVPSVLGSRLISSPWPANTALRLLVVGGDALPHGPTGGLPFQVVNHYGPTECTVVSTFATLSPGSSATPPIGCPINGAKIYLLDERRKLVSDGMVGEIYIAGAGVGRGYRNRPDLNQRSFLPDPFSSSPTARMYRTGDRAFRRHDGQLQFCGRIDRQTKIRGYRVELDEIAAVLNQHPAIDFAAVIATLARDGENQLLAYVLLKPSVQSLTKHEVQNHLLDRLPAYMVPCTFVRLRALPLNSNGKLDLLSLPSLATADLLNGLAPAIPASPTEAKLLTMVRELLSNDAISLDDSFFLAGGHSLLGMQLVLRVRDLFGVDVTLRQLFEAPTVRRLSSVIQRILDHSAEAKRANNPIFWVQSRVLDFAHLFGDDQPLFCVALDENDFTSLATDLTIPRIASVLVRKIRQTQPLGPYSISGFCLGGLVAYEIAFQLKAAGEDVSLLALLDAPNPVFLGPRNSWSLRFSYFRYVLARARDLGPRLTAQYACERFAKKLTSFLRLGHKTPHQLTELAARTYQPPKYSGDVLLLLASEHPPYLDLAAGWRPLIDGDVELHYVRAYHRDFLKDENAKHIARTIRCHIPSNPADSSSPWSAPVPVQSPVLPARSTNFHSVRRTNRYSH
jgi:amino acid adenylation domain-containing protein